jgi:putative transcriptional regulator
MISQKAESDNFLEGKLLIAMPGMGDPRFEKSVIFMCAHSSDGAMGLIVNKPVTGLAFRDLIEKLELEATDGMPDLPVLYGGPVQTERGLVLHSKDYAEDETTVPVSGDLALTGTRDILKAMAKGQGPREAMFALGYAGWGPGQIESEIRANGWIHCDADPTLLFNQDMDSKWSRALGKLGIDASVLSPHAGRA